MLIIVKDYSHITKFIERNRKKFSEAQMAATVKAKLESEFASEAIIEDFMWEAKPKTMLDESLIKRFGSKEAVMENLQLIGELLRRSASE